MVNSQPNPFEFSEADTCREYVTPAIQAAGWGDNPFEIAEQRSFSDSQIKFKLKQITRFPETQT